METRSSQFILEINDIMQNAELRTVTGCAQDRNIQHMHDEALILPIHEHLQFYALQYRQKIQHPNKFSAFFTNKILNIRSEQRLTDTHTGGSVTNYFFGVPLNTFIDATEADIWNIIKLSQVKSCELDHLPTWLLKECKDELVP